MNIVLFLYAYLFWPLLVSQAAIETMYGIEELPQAYGLLAAGLVLAVAWTMFNLELIHKIWEKLK
jgi:hypothetical protein